MRVKRYSLQWLEELRCFQSAKTVIIDPDERPLEGDGYKMGIDDVALDIA